MALGLLLVGDVEVLFKRHFWVAHLLFILAVVWLMMRTANGFLETALLPLPVWQATGQVRVENSTVTALSLERTAKALGLPVPKPEPTVTEPEVPKLDTTTPPVRTSLRVKLLGTLVSEGTPEWSLASIQDIVTLKSATYMIGDQVQGAAIIDIERLRVIILHNNRREFIDATPGDGSAAPPPMVPAISARPVVESGAPPMVALGAGVKQLSDNDYEIPRTEIDRTLANLNDVAMQARIVPHFKDGVAQGFKLFSIRPDSIYSKIGIQNGDVIKRINGFDLNSPEKALEVYSKLKESSRIDIEVERNGSAVRKTYQVK